MTKTITQETSADISNHKSRPQRTSAYSFTSQVSTREFAHHMTSIKKINVGVEQVRGSNNDAAQERGQVMARDD
jgi:hypothetical protein